MSAKTGPTDQTRQKTKRKLSFSFIEILIVFSIVMSVSVIFMTKGVAFVKNYQLNQEKKIFEHSLDRAFFFSKIHNCPVEISLVSRAKEEVLFEIKDLTYSKVFKHMKLDSKKVVFSISPNEELKTFLSKKNFF